MEKSRPLSTHVEKGLSLSNRDGLQNDQEELNAPYAQAVGNLMYPMFSKMAD